VHRCAEPQRHRVPHQPYLLIEESASPLQQVEDSV
jgi:hypothetical protein